MTEHNSRNQFLKRTFALLVHESMVKVEEQLSEKKNSSKAHYL